MVRMPNSDGYKGGRTINPESSSGIYVTASVEADCRSIAHNWKVKEKDKIKNININALKRATRMNQYENSFAKRCEITVNLPNDIIDSENPSTPLLQFLLYF